MISTAQAPVTSGSASSLATVAPGATVTLSVPSGTVYVGDSGVTAATGAPVGGWAPIANPVTGTATALYGIGAAGTVACGVITTSPR